MINPEGQSQDGTHTLAKLAALYPLAFAMVAASNTRAGLALRRTEGCQPEVSPQLRELAIESNATKPDSESSHGEKTPGNDASPT